jgi:hypothetical protein
MLLKPTALLLLLLLLLVQLRLWAVDLGLACSSNDSSRSRQI